MTGSVFPKFPKIQSLSKNVFLLFTHLSFEPAVILPRNRYTKFKMQQQFTRGCQAPKKDKKTQLKRFNMITFASYVASFMNPLYGCEKCIKI